MIFHIGQLGDAIVALPAIWAIRNKFPDSYLAILSDRHNKAEFVSALDIFPIQGLIDEFVFFEVGKRGGAIWKSLGLFNSIKGRFDALVYLIGMRSKWQVCRDLFFFRMSGIKRFIGHYGVPSYKQIYAKKPFLVFEHISDNLLRRLATSGIPVPASGCGCMELLLTEEEIKVGKAWLQEHTNYPNCGRLVGLGIGGKCPTKIWPNDRYGLLGPRIIKELDGFPIIFGGPEDRNLGDRLINEWGTGANAAGHLNVRQAAAALSFCQLYVGNDTGTTHLAAAVGTPCVGIFSARGIPGRWYPYGNQHIVLRRPIACEGCMTFDCPKNSKACLEMISVQDVMEACQNYFSTNKKFSPADRSMAHH